MPLKQVEFLFGHEVLHVVYDHMGRNGERDRKIANIAADFCVNADLLEQRVGEKIPVGLYDQKYAGWSMEEVYDDLMENADKMEIEQYIDKLLDEHLDGDGEGEGEGDGEGKDGKGRPKLSEEERKQIRDEIKDAVMQAAQAAGAGNLPGGVKRLIKDLTEPQISWKELLEQQIQSTIKSDYTFARPGRKSWHMDAILPASKPGETIDVVIGIDTSGSITESDLKISKHKTNVDDKCQCNFAKELCLIRVQFTVTALAADSYQSDAAELHTRPCDCLGSEVLNLFRFAEHFQLLHRLIIFFADGNTKFRLFS